jgi:hypothetical protein
VRGDVARFGSTPTHCYPDLIRAGECEVEADEVHNQAKLYYRPHEGSNADGLISTTNTVSRQFIHQGEVACRGYPVPLVCRDVP